MSKEEKVDITKWMKIVDEEINVKSDRALVITIVLLLILATITINFAVGNGGIFNRAEEATDIAEQGEANEQAVFDTSMDSWANLVDDSAEEAGILYRPAGLRKLCGCQQECHSAECAGRA